MVGELTPGKQIDSRCTRCKLVTGHIIVIMNGQQPTRVKCNSCGSEHKYRAAPEAPERRQSVRRSAVVVRSSDGHRREVRSSGGGRAAPDKTPRNTGEKRSPGKRAGPARLDPVVRFAQLCDGKQLGHVRPYAAGETFCEDDLVLHAALGLGIVVKVREGKVDVFFKSNGEKTLVHAR